MKVHYTVFGVGMQPNCADKAGFVSYSLKHVRARREPKKASVGTLWVREQIKRIGAWRECK